MSDQPPSSAGEPTSKGRPLLSLIIPCYDEAETLPLLIGRIEEAFADEREIEVVLVDNGSSDETPSIMASLAGHPILRSVRVEVNQGYGFGILEGLRAARGRYLGWTHADMQADPGDALEALDRIRESGESDAIYVKGSRYGRPLMDVVFTVGMAVFETVLLRTRLWDISAQPNVFPRGFYEAIERNAPHDFSLDLYFYHAARRRGLRMLRFPVRFGERAHGSSHWNVDWAAKRRFIANTVRYSLELRDRVSRSSEP